MVPLSFRCQLWAPELHLPLAPGQRSARASPRACFDELHLAHPVYGRPRLTAVLRREGFVVNEKRVGRWMRVMDLEAIYCKPGTSQAQPGHESHR